MFRPQFYWPTPPGYKDVPFVKPVTFSQNQDATLPAGQQFRNYIIQMDWDAPQLIRSLFWQGANQGQAAGPLSGSEQVQLIDAFDVEMTDGYIPIWLFAWGSGVTQPDGGSGRAKTFEPEIFCPAGSVLKVNFFNPDGADLLLPGLFEMRGIKRLPEGCQ